jgi:hypothetical protein
MLSVGFGLKFMKYMNGKELIKMFWVLLAFIVGTFLTIAGVLISIALEMD